MDELYREELLELYREPINRGSLKNPTVSYQKNNPFCGDTVKVELLIQDNLISDIRFNGEACAVSVIASSLLSEHVIGMQIEMAKKITKEELLELININLTTSRVKCAALFLDALHAAISEYQQKNGSDEKN